MSKVKPIIKYFGGKSKKFELLHSLFPERYEAYFEPFFGGGSVGLNVPTNKARHFNDINPHLMNMYRQIRNEPNEVLRLTDILFDNCTEDYFYLMKRTKFDDKVLEAARYLFLYSLSYGGITSTKFTYGYPTKPHCLDHLNHWSEAKKNTLREVSVVLKQAHLHCGSYEALKPQQGDFIYADPPYVTVPAKYLVSWSEADHFKLFDWCEEQTRKGVLLLLSYEDNQLIHNLYRKYNIETRSYNKRNAHNKKGTHYKPYTELTIRNY